MLIEVNSSTPLKVYIFEDVKILVENVIDSSQQDDGVSKMHGKVNSRSKFDNGKLTWKQRT